MKKLWLLMVLSGFCSSLPVLGQVQDGTKYWGGTVSFFGNANKNKETPSNSILKYNQHTISPELQWGKFTNATTMIGLGARYSFSRVKGYSESSSIPNSREKSRRITQSVGLFPYLRKYKTLGDRWAVFLHAELGASYGWISDDNRDQQESYPHYWLYEVNLKPGLVYFFPKKNLAIEGYADILSLNARYLKPPNFYGAHLFNFNTGFSTQVPTLFTLRIAKYIPTSK